MASIIKADNIQKVSDGTNIIKKCGSTITLGSCGATIALACGATQTGFGRTGTVDWCTTAKTAPFTGVSGNGYFVNTTCGAVTVTLPATPTAGDIISIADYASTFQTNNLTICRNSSKINGECANATLNTIGQSITLVYVDGTRGWKNTMDSTSDITGAPNFIVASGGTETNSPCGNFKIHTFTSDGFFAVTNAGTPAGSTTVDYLVIAGGGGGGGFRGGGGGAGGYRESYNPCTSGPYSASPLATPTSLPVSVQSYPITVGGGGSGGVYPPNGCSGVNSVFSTITSAGGGGGASQSGVGAAGGSGGGAHGASPCAGGAGNTPPTSPPQGNPGGPAGPTPTGYNNGSGGGGAGASGGVRTPTAAGIGGDGVTTSISASPTSYAGGGGAGATGNTGPGQPGGAGGLGGGGPGSPNTPPATATAGTTNTGGGGGAGADFPTSGGSAGATGGSGIVIIRYKFQ
jgi:hypothetical protein